MVDVVDMNMDMMDMDMVFMVDMDMVDMVDMVDMDMVEMVDISTIFLKSSKYINIDVRHRNPNIHIKEIIWLGNQLPPTPPHSTGHPGGTFFGPIR